MKSCRKSWGSPWLVRWTTRGLVGAATAHWLSRRIRRYEIAERSMAPALMPGDYVVAVIARRHPMRGDIVILAHPERSNFEIVKRVIGLPREHVAIAEGRVLIDGAVMPEPWTVGLTSPDGEWWVNEDEVFVLGDHRDASSADSRSIGPVRLDGPVWLAALRYWPLERAGLL